MAAENAEVPTPYRYFVSYAHVHGFGCIQIQRSQPVTDMRHVKAMRELIAQQGVRDPVILNFQLFPTNEQE